MSGELTGVFIVAIVFFSTVAVVKIVSDNIIRRRLIEKGNIDESVKFLYAHKFENNVPSSLKWGMVLIAVGAAILVGQYFPYTYHEEATISGMFIMAGLALVAYYFIAGRMAKKSEEDAL